MRSTSNSAMIAIEQAAIGDRPGELAADEAAERRVERVDVERDDGGVGRGEARDERVADLAARAGDQDDGFAHIRFAGPQDPA